MVEAEQAIASLAAVRAALLARLQVTLVAVVRNNMSRHSWKVKAKARAKAAKAQHYGLVALRNQNKRLEAEVIFLAGAYNRLRRIIPVFEEARDALCALTVTQCRLHNIKLDLADRMDKLGTE